MNDLFKTTIDSLEENISGGIKLTDGQAFIDAIKEVQISVASDVRKLFEMVAGDSHKLLSVIDLLNEIKVEMEILNVTVFGAEPSAEAIAPEPSAPTSSTAPKPSAPIPFDAPPIDFSSIISMFDGLRELIVTHFNAAHSSADRRAERSSADILSSQSAVEAHLQLISENFSQQQAITQRSLDEYHSLNDNHFNYLKKGT